jgi:hypothetical protein
MQPRLSKDENLDPIKSCGIPQSITQLKAFLGATQQMAQYVPYYALVAAPADSKRSALPNWKQANGSKDPIMI